MQKIYLSILVVLLFVAGTAWSQARPAYQIFTADGKPADYGAILQAMKGRDVVLFGEYHDNPISHWLQLELTRDMGNAQPIVLGAEMFETDNQQALDDFLAGKITAKGLDTAARLWKNYKTDYAPLVDFAREKGIRFVATNIPRRYAAIVNQKGFEGLDSINAHQRAMIAPLPIKYDSTLECYASIGNAVGEGMAHTTMHLGEAQAIKDATMAHFILKNWESGKTFLHFNGSYHSDDFQGTVWYVNLYGKRLPYIPKVVTISALEQDTLDDLSQENIGKADFIICIPSSMTKTR